MFGTNQGMLSRVSLPFLILHGMPCFGTTIRVSGPMGIRFAMPGATPIAFGSRSNNCPFSSAIFVGSPPLIETTSVDPVLE